MGGNSNLDLTGETTTGSNDLQFRTISVSGVGRVMAAPDVADISLGVYEQAKEASAASQRAAESMDSVIQALLGLGVPEADIQTTNISLNPRYDWNKEPAQVVGWEATNTVDVTVRDIDTVGTVIDTVVAAGANQIARAVLEQTGRRTVFHHHCAGYVETPAEITRLLDLTDPALLGLVFDTGHYAYGAGGCQTKWMAKSVRVRVVSSGASFDCGPPYMPGMPMRDA